MPRIPWTAPEIDLLRQLYPDNPMSTLRAVIDRAPRAIYDKAAKLGLKKSSAYLSGPHATRLRPGHVSGLRTRFQPGQKPWNKGLKGLDIGGKDTRYKSGNRSGKAAMLYQPIGALRITKDGYLQRKIHDCSPIHSRWRSVHVLVWESAHGQVPRGHIVVFRPGKKTTIEAEITLDRIECITRQENMRRNTYHQYPKEIALAIQLKGTLTRQINQRSKP